MAQSRAKPQSRMRKFTDKTLQAMAKARTKEEWRDQDCTCLLARVRMSGGVTFYWTGRDATGKPKKTRIGEYPGKTLKEARFDAQRIAVAEKAGDMHLTKGADRGATSPAANPIPSATPSQVGNMTDPGPSLGALLCEFEAEIAKTLTSWRPKRREARAAFDQGRLAAHLEKIDDEKKRDEERRSNARAVVECVFGALLDASVVAISADDLADTLKAYQRKKRRLADPDGPPTANGQASRARAYLATALNWAAGRGKFRQTGKHRRNRLNVADLQEVFDPSEDDDTIMKERARILDGDELKKLLPLFVYPAPMPLWTATLGPDDVRPAALAFQFFTFSRIGEVQGARWSDIDFENGIWTKSVKSRGSRRKVDMPLIDEAIAILTGLPTYPRRMAGGLIFTNDGSPFASVPELVDRLSAASGVQNWITQDLRRTAATIALTLKVAPHVIGAGLGHKNAVAKAASARATATYARFSPRMNGARCPIRQAFELVAKFTATVLADGDGECDRTSAAA